MNFIKIKKNIRINKLKNLLFFLLICFSSIRAQRNSILKWKIIAPKEIHINEEVELFFKIELKPFWYIHSTNIKDRNGKNTALWFHENGDFKIIGKTEAIYEIEELDKLNIKLKYIIEEEGGLAQKIKILNPNPVIKGQINYILCNRSNNQEIAQVYHFEIQLRTNKK